MSWQQYLELPEKPRAEWVDGVAVIMNAPPRFDHGSAAAQLILLLGPRFPDHYVVTEVFLRLPRNRVRLPDVMLTASRPDDGWVSEPPPMVAEVLSQSTRSEDMVRKSVEYAEAGIGQYWLVDPELRSIEVMHNVDGAWEVLARVDDDHPEAEVELEGATVRLDLGQVIRG
jgi:Uma2 family endonuclease